MNQSNKVEKKYSGSTKEKRDVLAALRYGSNVPLCFASYETLNDRKFMLKAIEVDEIAFDCLSEELAHDKGFLIEAIKANPEIVDFIDKALLDDPEFVYQAILKANLYIDHVKEEFIIDKRFAIALVQSNSNYFKDLNATLQNDIDIIKIVVRENYQILHKIDSNNKIDISLYIEALKYETTFASYKFKEIYQMIPKELLTRENIIKLVSTRGCVFNYLPDIFKGDREILMIAIKNDGSVYQKLSLSLRKDSEILLEAIKTCWHITKYVPKSFFDDPKMVEILLEYNNEFFEHATAKVKNHYKTAKKYVSSYYNGLCRVGEELQNNKKFVLMSIKEHRNNYLCANKALQNDIDIIEEAAKQKVYFKDMIECLTKTTLNNPTIMKELVKQNIRFCEYLPSKLKAHEDFIKLCRIKPVKMSKNTRLQPIEVRVEFPELYLEYSYNCEIPGVEIGDQVKVSGKLSDETGIVTTIIGYKNPATYMQNITKIISKKTNNTSDNEKQPGMEVTVEFPELYLEYNYNCALIDIKIGDHVRVSGKLSDEIGIVSSIVGKKNNAPYMQDIIQILPQKEILEVKTHFKMDLDQENEFYLGDMIELQYDDTRKTISLEISFTGDDVENIEVCAFEIDFDSGEGIEGEHFANTYSITCENHPVAYFVINELSNHLSAHDFDVSSYHLDNKKVILQVLYHFTDIGYSE